MVEMISLSREKHAIYLADPSLTTNDTTIAERVFHRFDHAQTPLTAFALFSFNELVQFTKEIGLSSDIEIMLLQASLITYLQAVIGGEAANRVVEFWNS